MVRQPPDRPGEAVLAGLWEIGRLRAAGVARFAATPEGLLASFLPGLILSLFGGLMAVMRDQAWFGLSSLLQTVCAVLAVPVLSQSLLQLWGAEGGWLRYATAYGWSRWLLLVAVVLMLFVAYVAAGLGISPQLALGTATLLAVVYIVAIDWLIARVALGLGWWRTLLLLLFVEIGTVVLVLGPTVIAYLVQPPASGTTAPSTLPGAKA